jgi:hypothetical protein
MRKSASNLRSLLDSFCPFPLHCSMSRTPDATSRKSAERAAREARLAKALRDNLRRRKEQARAQDRVTVARPEDRARKSQGEHEPTA